MPSASHNPSYQPLSGVRLALRDLTAEGSATAVRLLAYLCGVGMLALIAADVISAAAPELAVEAIAAATKSAAAPASSWSRASRPDPAFAVSVAELPARTESYESFRRVDGARRDVLRWSTETGQPLAEIAVERAADPEQTLDPVDLPSRMGVAGPVELEAAGLVETKFGHVSLWRVPETPSACLGFARAFETPKLRISGFSCAATDRAAQQHLIGCALDRLVLLSAGNNAELAALFAQAELRRGSCGAGQAAAVDWVVDATPPKLRGRL